ncbi:MAG: flagellar hook-basal body complex protein [Candidatus Micropelagos sp.]|nr:flagellar hook-basal body complex protein [Candidatus Micropelagos sp.]
MSFYTALTGLNGSQADISATSNNIANVGTTGFKRSRAEFGDIFATSPLQNASSSIGSGTILKGIKQQFTQGNIASSLNALDLAISGQGFFSLKPSLTSNQNVYTRNGSLNVNNDRYVVDSAGQFLLVYPVNQDGSVTAKDLISAVPLQLPVTSGDPQATANISLGVNLPADAEVVTEKAQFADGYNFNPDNPNTFTNSTSITIFDDLGNPTIATIYFIKTQATSADDPTNKYDTRLVIGDTIINPDLVPAVDDASNQIFIDRFGAQTTSVPDDNYFLEGKGSALYKLDDLQQQVDSQPAKIQSETTAFDFGDEGDKLVEIVTDPMQFKATREAGSANDVYWGKDFLLLNVDDGDQPVSIDIRPGTYNAADLADEVQRAINTAYGDDKKIQVVQNVDNEININLSRLNSDGTTSSLKELAGSAISVDLLSASYVTDIENIDLSGASPDFTKEQFLAHTQARLNTALNEFIVGTNDTINTTNLSAFNFGNTGQLFARSEGAQITNILEQTQIFNLTHNTLASYTDAASPGGVTANGKFLVYSFYGERPSVNVYDDKKVVSADADNNTMKYDATQNTLTVNLTDTTGLIAGETIQIAGEFSEANASFLNGRSFQISNVIANTSITINTTGLGLPDTGFNITSTTAHVLSDESTTVEAFFEGADNVFEGALDNFSSKKIIVRETDAAKHKYTNTEVETVTGAAGIIDIGAEVLTLEDNAGVVIDTLEQLGFETALNVTAMTTTSDWVNEKNPPLTVAYDELNQRLQFEVDRTILGTGTEPNFNSFEIYGAENADVTNNLGIPAEEDASTVLIRGGEILNAETLVADGEEIQLNDKRFGVQVEYNSDTKTFSFLSGSTGENIAADGALGVTEEQKASNIQIGRFAISDSDGTVINSTFDLSQRTIGAGDNQLMGVGSTKTDIIFSTARGLGSLPAIATSTTAQENLSEVFTLSSQIGENIFNVSVNGISGIITVPGGSYVGSTLATALEERINQVQDPVTGETVGGVKVSYNTDTNNFTFTTGTRGNTSTIKVNGSAKLGLDDVPLGVGSIPKIFNLVQATNSDGVALFVNAEGEVVESPPANLVEGYFPLYIDEGELTFDKTGTLVSPKNTVHYEKQEEGVSISLDIDFSASTQFAQPFSVVAVDQDGFTSGRLDGLEIDASGTIRANYTNGLNNPLGKIVVANFNNQNGLKQIGNATYVETAVSGSPQVGEAGAEGFGNILSGSLERSNVDITEELVNLITAQRNFQASAKAIETTTTLTQSIVNIRM